MKKTLIALALIATASSANAGLQNNVYGESYTWNTDTTNRLFAPNVQTALTCEMHGYNNNDRDNNAAGRALEGELLGTVHISVANSTPRLRSADFMANNERFNFTQSMLDLDYGVRSTRIEGDHEPVDCPDGEVWNGTECVVPLPDCDEGYHHEWQTEICVLDLPSRYNTWSRWSFGASNITSALESHTLFETFSMRQSFKLEMDSVSGDRDQDWVNPADPTVAHSYHKGGFHTNEYGTNAVRMHGHWAAQMSGQQTASGDWWEGNATVNLGGEYSCTSSFSPEYTAENWMARSARAATNNAPLKSQLTNYELRAWMDSAQEEIVNPYTNTPLNSKQVSANWQETAPLVNTAPPQSSGGNNGITCSPAHPCDNADGAGSFGLGLSIIGLIGLARRKMK